MTFSDQVQHAVELKNALIDYVDSPRFSRLLQERIAAVRPYVDSDDAAWNQAAEELLFTDGAAGQRTLLDRYIATVPNLTPADLDMLEGWRDDNVYGLFQVTSRDNELLGLDNLIDGLSYEAYVTEGADATRPAPRGSYLQARLVPVGPAWITSGGLAAFPAHDRLRVGTMVSRLLAFDPTAAFRNPDYLARATQYASDTYNVFVSLFGADIMAGTGREAKTRFERFLDAREAADATGKADAPAAAATPAGAAMAASSTRAEDFPASLVTGDDVALYIHPIKGIGVAAGYRLLEEAHRGGAAALPDDAPALGELRRWLDDPEIPAHLLEALASAHPETVNALYRVVLGDPAFTWADDGEELLRERKPESFIDEDLPTVVLLPPIALDAAAAASVVPASL